MTASPQPPRRTKLSSKKKLPETQAGQALYARAKAVIPGGTQLLSKRPEMFLPGKWPSYFQTASGISITDVDGNVWRDMGYHGIGACALGYANQAVDDAVRAAIAAGSASVLNCPEEVQLAERLVGHHGWADMARFTRSGGEAMSVAVRIARAATGRDRVLVCGYHGWHDWYIAANIEGGQGGLAAHLLPGLAPAGVPQDLGGSVTPFHYNDVSGFHEALGGGGDVAAIVMEPQRSQRPEAGFLEGIRDAAQKHGSVLMFDEVTSGFRTTIGGHHKSLGIAPDMAVFAKSLGNGYPIGAIIGRREIMDAAQNSFISSTAWTERTGFAAALAVFDVYESEDVPGQLTSAGERVRMAITSAADETNLDVTVSGIPPLTSFSIKVGEPAIAKTVFVQEMMRRGFLATTSFYATTAHSAADLDAYGTEIAEVFALIADAERDGRLRNCVEGEPAHAGFYRLV